MYGTLFLAVCIVSDLLSSGNTEILNYMPFLSPDQPQTSLGATSSGSNKKVYLIVGVIGFAIIVLIPLILGLMSPTNSPKTKIETENSKSGSSQAASPSPAKSQASLTFKTVPITPGNAPAQTKYTPPTPIPTVDLDNLLPTTTATPTPSPLPGPFYTPNGKQNDLTIRLYTPDISNQNYEVQLINTTTHEVRIMGYTYLYSPGDSTFFSSDFSQVMFLGGKKNDMQMISFYSIPNRTVVKTITLGDMQKAIPTLQVQPTAVLSNMLISPDGKKVALSYGNTFSENLIDPNTVIFVIDLATQKMRMLPVRGLTKDWKDNNTLEYQNNNGTDPNNNVVQEIPVPAL